MLEITDVKKIFKNASLQINFICILKHLLVLKEAKEQMPLDSIDCFVQKS